MRAKNEISIDEKVECLRQVEYLTEKLLVDYATIATCAVGIIHEGAERANNSHDSLVETLASTIAANRLATERIQQYTAEISHLRDNLSGIHPADVPEEYRSILIFLQ